MKLPIIRATTNLASSDETIMLDLSPDSYHSLDQTTTHRKNSTDTHSTASEEEGRDSSVYRGVE